MTTTLKTNVKKFVMALGIAALGFSGINAMAGDVAGAARSGKPYQNYTDQETIEMLDTISRDYPVSYNGLSGRNYTRYDGDNAEEMIDAMSRSEPVAVVGHAPAAANPFVKIDGDNAHELIAALDRADHAGYSRTMVVVPAATVYAPAASGAEYVQAPAAVEAKADDSLAQTLSTEKNG